MAWEGERDRALLLELRLTGIARRRRGQEELLSVLERQGWVRATRRASEVVLVEGRENEATSGPKYQVLTLILAYST